MKFKIYELSKIHPLLSSSEVGGKGHNLHRLIRNNINAPPAVVLSLGIDGSHIKDLPDEIINTILELPAIKHGKLFAVRSSANVEDGMNQSYAGMFDTVLDVSKSQLKKAIIKVQNSLNSSRHATYIKQQKTQDSKMHIVIQQMIDPDYAGVAFSADPITADQRIGVIELVKGSGEALVSGEKTPTTIRINKITGMKRIIQHGIDEIKDKTTLSITDKLSDQVAVIEKIYEIPVDIEWGVKRGVIYIFQARPITTGDAK